jgi:imidazolonepropionase-like amidohydrolase
MKPAQFTPIAAPFAIILALAFMLSASSAAAQAAPQQPTQQRTVIHAGGLIDGESNARRTRVTIIVQNDRITAIQDGFTQPGANDRLIDLSTKTVLPGLIDLHVHLESETSPSSYIDRFTLNEADIAFRASSFARRTLLAGFTTVRDLGGSGVNISLRNAIRGGLVEGPRIISVGKSLATTGGHADPTNGWRRDIMGDPGPREGVVNGEADARQAVRQRYKDGADHIKITATGGVLSLAASGQNPQFMIDELEAIVETARDYGMHVAAHAHGKEGMLRAVNAGVLTIEHGTYMDEEVMRAMVARGTYYVPTISAGKWVAEKAEVEGYYPAVVRPKAREIGPLIQNTFAVAYRFGVKIAFGTDAGVFPHGINGREFEYMVQAGMPAIEAIRSATVVAATVLGLDGEIGSVAVGKRADIVAVNDDPLQNIATMAAVIFVMRDGVVYKQ